MRYLFLILLVFITLFSLGREITSINDSIEVEFLGKFFKLPSPGSIESIENSINPDLIEQFARKIHTPAMSEIANSLVEIQKKESLDDWLFYQLIRRTANLCIKKSTNFNEYTLIKWYLLKETGFEPLLSISKTKILLYINSDEIIYNLPLKKINNQEYICLNYHDYDHNIEFENENFVNLISLLSPAKKFSFKINQLPDFALSNYRNKEIIFQYKKKEDRLNIKINPSVKSYFTNYPVTNYQNQFNIPLSKETHQSLIPALKEKIKKFNINQGVEYLMYFTRHAFLYERDTENFGREKRLSPEETLLYEKSDCEDRSALFYFLVKEIYNLPMIVISYPEHVTVAVKLDIDKVSKIIYQGESYTICEPTPQKTELKLGKVLPSYQKKKFEVAYAYSPKDK